MQQSSTFHVYNASAGSGKTFTLVKEYLKIVLKTADPNYFRHILAVTFTNKAAAEMKERVIANLRTFSKSEILQQKTDMFLLIENELNITEIIIHQRAAKVLKSILNNYAAFNITTIDSFTHRLIRSFALDLGLSINFEVEMDAKSLLNEAVDALLSKMGEDETLTKILIEFSLDKTNEDKSWDISRELREIAQLLLNESDRLHVEHLNEKPLTEYLDLKQKLIKNQKVFERELDKIGKKGLEIIENAKVDHKDFYYTQFPKHFQNLINNLESVSYDPDKGLAKSIIANTFYTKNKSENVKASIDAIIDRLIGLYSNSEIIFKQYTLNKLFLTSLVPLAVLSSINKSLDELKEENNIRLNAEFNQLISKNLQQQPAAYIYERIGERFKHYFIDEMQDTSQLQWQNLIPLINNALSQEGTSLLLVGDTKQSIYRWRGSEPEQFSKLSYDGNTPEHNPFYIPKGIVPLDTNYRSYTEVIDFNNKFFQHVAGFFNKQEYADIYTNENQQRFTKKEGGYVQLSFLDDLNGEEKEEAYAEKVLELVNMIEDQFNLNEICILTRTRKQGVAIADFLSNNGITIISSETLLLQNSEKVIFIINLLKYLQNKQHKEAKFNVLYYLYDHFNLTDDKHDFLKKYLDKKDFYITDFKEDTFYSLSLYESVEYIIRTFNLNISADAYLQFFLDEVLQFSQQKATDIAAFLEYWDEKKDTLSIVVPEEKNAVRIMTIHKSKGLEFPVVIYPFDLDIYKEQNPKVWYPLSDVKDNYNGFETLLVSCNKALEQSGEVGNYLYNHHKNELELDNFNLLYVAFTRAVEQLYIIGENKKTEGNLRSSSQFLKHFLQSVGKWDDTLQEVSFGNSKRISKKTDSLKNAVELTGFTSTSWQSHNITIVPSSSVLWGTEAGASITYGNLIHELLSFIKTEDDIEETIEKYVLEGYINASEKESIEHILQSITEHPELKIYYKHNLTVYNEREILTRQGEIIIPDRLVINENNEAVIIDYKTGKQTADHIQQLEKYADVVSQLNYNVIKKILVYIGESLTIEEV